MPVSFEDMRKEQKLSFTQMRDEQQAWRPPTAEEEAVEEDWGAFASGVAALATAPVSGFAAAITAGVTALAAERGSEYLGGVAGRVHPALAVPAYIGTGILSAFTLEKWLINGTAKAAKGIPKFWSKEFTLAKHKGLLSGQFIDDHVDIIKRMDMGDKKATDQMLNIFRQEAYQERLIKTGKQLEKLQLKDEIIEPATKVMNQLRKKKTLDMMDYRRLEKAARAEAVYEYTRDFAKSKTQIISKAATDKWRYHEMKDIFDTIIKDGGVSPQFKFVSQELKDAFVKRHPNLKATKAVTAKLERIADNFGYTDVNKMVSDILHTPNQTMLRQMSAADLAPEFKRIYNDEILGRVAAKEADYLYKLHEFRGVERFDKIRAAETLRRATKVLPAKLVIREVTALKQSVSKLLNVMQKAALDKKVLSRLQKTFNQKLVEYQTVVKIQKELGLINGRLKASIGQKGEYGEQLNRLLAPLFRNHVRKLDENMFAFLTRKYNDEVSIGADILIKKYDGLLKNFPFRSQDFLSLTYKQAKDLDDFVRTFKFVADNERYIVVEADKLLTKIVAKEINQTAATTIPRIKLLQPRLTNTQLEELAISQTGALANAHRASTDVLNGALATLKRMEPICYQLDGFKQFGRAWHSVFNKMVMAEVAKEQLGRRVFGHYKEIFAAHKAATKIKPKKYWSATSGNLAGHSISKENALIMALNSNHPDNLKAMLEGLQVSKKDLSFFLKEALNTTDLKMADDILDSLDDLFPLIAKIHKQKTGTTLQKVKGGRYFPILMDRRFSEVSENIDDLFLDPSAERFLAEVKKTFTEFRVGGVKAVRLDFNGLTQHLSDVVHYTTHWGPVNEVQRLTKSKEFRQTVESTMGREVYAQFSPWLQNLARPSFTKIDRWMGKARRNVTFASLALVPKIAVKQTLSFITAMPEIGYTNAVASLSEFMRNPGSITKAIREASPEMAYRSKTWNRDLAEMMSEISPTRANSALQRVGFIMIHKVDAITSSVVWLGAYNKGLKMFSGNGNRAANYAMSIVRKTQPASAAKDIPKIMRSGEGYRALTMFYSYWSVYHNQVAEKIAKGLSGHMTLPEVAGTLAWLVVAPVVTQQLASAAWNALTGREQEDEKGREIAKGVGVSTVSGIPVIRDLATAAIQDFDYRVSPIETMVEETVDVLQIPGKILDEDEELNLWDLESVIKFGSYIRPFPSKAFITAVRGGLRLYDKDTKDWSELIDNPPYERSK